METPAKSLRVYRVRDFTAEDLGEVSRLICETIDACYRGVYPEQAIEYFKEYHSEAHILEDARSGYAVVVEVDGRIVATGTLLGANVRRVFVHPSYQHHGFGKLVMGVLEQHAAGQGIHVVDLSSSLVSKRFYDSLGYATEKKDHFPVRNGERLTYYAMVKSLDDAVLVIRPKSEQRLARFRALCQQYAASLGFDLRFQDFEEEMRTLPGEYGPPRGCLLLAVRHDEAMGCVAIRWLEDGICEMKRLFVRPSHRGQGIGRQLAREAIDEARRIGYRRMRLDTAPGMDEAGSLYRSLGFGPIEPYCHNPIPGATYMELDIARAREGAS